MLTISENQTVYIYLDAIDMRKSMNGLCYLLIESFEQNPQSGDLYLFTSRTRDKIKCILWDKNGFVLYYKRLEKGRFNYSKYLCGDKIVVTSSQLRALLMGLDFYILGEYPETKMASASLLAQIAIQKFCDHLPLYRQESIFNCLSIQLTRQTMSEWMIKVGDAIVPLVNLLQEKVLEYDVAYADETTLQVLNEPHCSAHFCAVSEIAPLLGDYYSLPGIKA